MTRLMKAIKARRTFVSTKQKAIMKQQITIAEKLEAIATKYCVVSHNDDNYNIGGGLDGVKFASRRHEDARNDAGKLTLGEAVQVFKKATGADIDAVREVIEYAVPNMEWHHAGKLPKRYGGGMKKTYFINAPEICMIATKWVELAQKLSISKSEAKIAAENQKSLEQRKYDFLKANATRYERVAAANEPAHKYRTGREMNGKYGWFDSSTKSYNLPEYFSGWGFESAEKLNEYYSLK